jgi:hypothetical protein
LSVSLFTVPEAGCAIAADAIIKRTATPESKRIDRRVVAHVKVDFLFFSNANAVWGAVILLDLPGASSDQQQICICTLNIHSKSNNQMSLSDE